VSARFDWLPARGGAGVLLLAIAACCSPRVPETTPDPPAVARPAGLPTDLGSRALAQVETLVGFGARHSGTPGWRSACDHIAGELRAMGLEPQRDRWLETGEDLTFENISAVIPGSVPDRIVIGAHHDTKITVGHDDPAHNFPFVGANDSGSGVGLLLELARHLVAHPPRATIEVAFFDGEESVPFRWNLERALFGSRRFVRRAVQERIDDPTRPPIRAMVLLDMVGAAALSIDDETTSDRQLHAIFRAAAAACGHQEHFFRHALRVGDDHTPFLDAGIPAIDLIDIYDNPEWHTPDDTLDRLSARSLQVVGEVVLAAVPAIEAAFVPGLGEDRGR
jgi:hypothetical protein